jgi:hypothetical protein
MSRYDVATVTTVKKMSAPNTLRYSDTSWTWTWTAPSSAWP